MEINDQIRAAAALVDIASQYTTLKKRGAKYVGLCPFHVEKTPSFTVDPDKQLFHCFGCGVGGDVFTLVMEKENLTFPEALRFLAQKFNIPLPQQSRIASQALKLEEKLVKVNEETLAFFQKSLREGAEGRKAREYLVQRNLSPETVKALNIGYAPNSWDSLVKHFQDRGVAPDLLLKAGLVLPGQKKEGFYDRFRGRLMFPIFGLTGKVIAFGGRTLFGAEPKYLNSPETPLYSKSKVLYGLNLTKDAIRDKGELILVEGYTDFAALFQAGFTHVVASLGTSLTPFQVGLAQRFAPRIIINYDGDAAGLNAALRGLSLCFEKGVPASVVVLPEKLDPDGFMGKYGPDGYRELLDKAFPALRFLIKMRSQDKNLNVPEEKAKLVNEVLAELAKIPDTVVLNEYLTHAAQLLKTSEDDLRRRLKLKLSGIVQEVEAVILPAEKMLLQILIKYPKLAPIILAEVRENQFAGLSTEPIFRLLQAASREGRELRFDEISQHLDSKLKIFLTQALMQEIAEPTADGVHDCLDALRQISLRRTRDKLNAEYAQAEKNGDNEQLIRLAQEIQDINLQFERK